MKVLKLWQSAKILAGCLLLGIFIKLLILMSSISETADTLSRIHSPRLIIPELYNRAVPAKPVVHENENVELAQLLLENAKHGWSAGDACAPYPRFQDIHIEQEYYQYTLGGNVSYYMYAAYYDQRPVVHNSPRIALLAMISSMLGPFADAYCQVWYEDSARPLIVKMSQQDIIWIKEWGNMPGHVYPVLMSCPLPKSPRQQRVPQLVSLVFENRCRRATNALRIVYEAPPRKRSTRFAVCMKDWQYPNVDMSDRIVEYFELMRLLGVERIQTYDIGNSMLPATRQTVNYYAQETDMLQVRAHKYLEGHPKPAASKAHSKCLNEVLMYVDCFYRNLYQFDYIAAIDLDEVIMPLGALRSWHALIEQLESNSSLAGEEHCQARASYCFRNVYYSRELPEDETPPERFYMLRHVQRVADHLGPDLAIKCLHSTAYVTTVHNHFPLHWYSACSPYDVPTSLGQLQHYREPDIKETLHMPPPKRDDSIWRFKDQLIRNTKAVQAKLGRQLP